jgi:hypothetical protein
MDKFLTEFPQKVEESVPSFIDSLKKPGLEGRYLLCKQGTTSIGRNLELGFSCFALRTIHILNKWNTIDVNTRANWVKHINSFQTSAGPNNNISYLANPYIDQPVTTYLSKNRFNSLGSRLRHYRNRLTLLKRYPLNPEQKLVIAETKQTIATLAEILESPGTLIGTFTWSSEDLYNSFSSFDWRYPWDAGGQTAAICALLGSTNNFRFTKDARADLMQSAKLFYSSLANAENGGYYERQVPNYQNLVNGAMKVLTALDWLNQPIHYPKQLIDTTLNELPNREGCHLVDTVYVLYRCSLETNYRKSEIIKYIQNISHLISNHYNTDGGFSYHINKSQTSYYGVPVSVGYHESDLHGTLLLTWALAMITKIVDCHAINWNLPKP